MIFVDKTQMQLDKIRNIVIIVWCFYLSSEVTGTM